MTITVAVRAAEGIATGSDLNVGYLAREDAESRAKGRATGMAAFLKFVDEAVDLPPEKPPVQALVERTKRAKTTFRKMQITRNVNRIKASKATGTFDIAARRVVPSALNEGRMSWLRGNKKVIESLRSQKRKRSKL
jgi:hypothetical protein